MLFKWYRRLRKPTRWHRWWSRQRLPLHSKRTFGHIRGTAVQRVAENRRSGTLAFVKILGIVTQACSSCLTQPTTHAKIPNFQTASVSRPHTLLDPELAVATPESTNLFAYADVTTACFFYDETLRLLPISTVRFRDAKPQPRNSSILERTLSTRKLFWESIGMGHLFDSTALQLFDLPEMFRAAFQKAT